MVVVVVKKCLRQDGSGVHKYLTSQWNPGQMFHLCLKLFNCIDVSLDDQLDSGIEEYHCYEWAVKTQTSSFRPKPVLMPEFEDEARQVMEKVVNYWHYNIFEQEGHSSGIGESIDVASEFTSSPASNETNIIHSNLAAEHSVVVSVNRISNAASIPLEDTKPNLLGSDSSVLDTISSAEGGLATGAINENQNLNELTGDKIRDEMQLSDLPEQKEDTNSLDLATVQMTATTGSAAEEIVILGISPLNLSWNFNLKQTEIDTAKSTSKFEVTCCKPTKLSPVPRASATIWFNVKRLAVNYL